MFMCSSVFLSNPHLSCLSSLSGCVSNIVQCSTLEYLIKKRKKRWDLLGGSEQFSRWSHLLSAHSFTKSHSIFLHFLCIHVQCFCLSCGGCFFACISVVNSHHEEVKNDHQHRQDDHHSHQHRHISLKLLTPPPVNMNVTCILCIYTIEIQHISPLYTLYPHMYRH